MLLLKRMGVALSPFLICGVLGCAASAQNYCYQSCQNNNLDHGSVSDCERRCDKDTNYGRGFDDKDKDKKKKPAYPIFGK